MDQLEELVRELRAAASNTSPMASQQPPRARHRHTASKRRWLLLSFSSVAAIALTLMIVPARHVNGTVPIASPTTTGRPAHSADTASLLRIQQPTPGQWRSIVGVLDAARSSTFAHPESATLRAVDAPASPAIRNDQRLIRALRRSGLHAVGFRVRLLRVDERYLRIGDATPEAEVMVSDALGAYQLAAADGSVVRTVAARSPRLWRVRLVLLPGAGWRVESVISAASQQ